MTKNIDGQYTQLHIFYQKIRKSAKLKPDSWGIGQGALKTPAAAEDQPAHDRK
jgi:hypothetical protein